MARAVRDGTVTVGALTVPVKVFTATQSHSVRFREPFHAYMKGSVVVE